MLALVWPWYVLRGHAGDADGKPAQSAAAPSVPPRNRHRAVAPPPVAAAPKVDPGKIVISAVGMIDPSDARYKGDKALAQSDVRADSRSQLVEKALGLFVDKASLAKNYDVLKDKLLANSGKYVSAVVSESEPQVGKDGLMYVTTEAVVDVKAVQKSLNQMSRDERIEFIRASGDPKVAVHIAARDADQPGAPPLPSPVAENILKERIKSFGFRTWSEGGAPTDDGSKNPDFAVEGEVAFKRLSARLPASGLVVTKYALNSWTIKAIDRETGEEIYYNTTLPTGLGSWATEEEALKAIGTQIGERILARFLPAARLRHRPEGHAGHRSDARRGRRRHVHAPARRIADGGEYRRADAGTSPDLRPAAGRKRSGRRPRRGRRLEAAQRATRPGVLFAGRRHRRQGAVVAFDPKCSDAAVLSRLETNPPAGLYGAPLSRQKAVIKDPEALKKLMI